MIGNGPRNRSVDFAVEMGTTKDSKFKDFYPGPKRALLFLGHNDTYKLYY